ncbi:MULTISPECIES: hypothetical protein [unclassified Bartonella]
MQTLSLAVCDDHNPYLHVSHTRTRGGLIQHVNAIYLWVPQLLAQ